VGLAAALVTLLVGLPTRASATDACPPPHDIGIWLEQGQPVGYGSQGTLFAVNHSLVPCGGGYTYQSYSNNMYGVILSSDFLDWVEVGYRKQLYCVVACSTQYKIWGEWGFYPSTTQYTFYTDATSGTSISFRANNVAGTFNWKIWYDPSGGSNYQLLDTYNNMWDTHGWAYGEASRVGKTGTDAVDHHWNMKFKNSSGNWQAFNALVCQNDTDPDYKWVRVSNTEFQVQAGSARC